MLGGVKDCPGGEEGHPEGGGILGVRGLSGGGGGEEMGGRGRRDGGKRGVGEGMR